MARLFSLPATTQVDPRRTLASSTTPQTVALHLRYLRVFASRQIDTLSMLKSNMPSFFLFALIPFILSPPPLFSFLHPSCPPSSVQDLTDKIYAASLSISKYFIMDPLPAETIPDFDKVGLYDFGPMQVEVVEAAEVYSKVSGTI